VSSALILAAARPVPRFVDRHTHVAALVRQYRDLLGEAQHRDFPLLPSPSQRIAVGQSANIRSLNVYNDPDDVVRRIPLSVVVDGETQPSMAVELAARALGAPATMIRRRQVRFLPATRRPASTRMPPPSIISYGATQ
jgi:hypothetical protein